MSVIKERIATTADEELSNHWQRYEFAKKYIKNKNVVSIACGSGYGEFYLATEGQSKSVLGIDSSGEAIANAKKNYQAKNLTFKQIDALKNNIDSQSFDVIISFETIEHINDDNKLLEEFLRILKTDGILILSTPNKASSFKNLLAKPTINPYHVREYRKIELECLLKKYFKSVSFFGQRTIFKRSFLRLPLYFIYKFSGWLRKIEIADNVVNQYPSKNNLEMCTFVVVCKK